jgi:hypothetical protein
MKDNLIGLSFFVLVKYSKVVYKPSKFAAKYL